MGIRDNFIGVDYGSGVTNIDERGYRYGVIPMHEVLQEWADSSEPEYVYSCECGEEFGDDPPDVCPACGASLDFDFLEPIAFLVEDGEYMAMQYQDDADIFITKSPYYTYCMFCSPCAPGAGYLTSPTPNGVKTYCFGHEWFDSGKAPYPVYSVKTGMEIQP